MSVTKALIDCVKSKPILYDMKHPDYKNLRKRDKVWTELGRKLNENGEELKKKWKNIRDCYQKYLRAVHAKSGQFVKRSYKNYQWAQQMEFFRPQTEFNGSEIGNQSETAQSSNEDSQSFQEENVKTIRRKRRRIETEADCLRTNNRPPDTSSDATDLIFLGYSKTIKTFSPMRQAIVKMRIAQIIMEEEINNLEQPTASNSSPIPQETVEGESQPCSSTTFSMKIEKDELY